MNELRLSALRVQQMVMNLGLEQIPKNAPTLEKQLNNAVKILQRRQIRIEDPGVRAQVATTLTTVSQYSDLLALYQQDSEISNHLQTLAQNNIAQFAQFSSEVSQLVDTIDCVISTDWRIWKKPVHAGNTACYCWGWFHFAH